MRAHPRGLWARGAGGSASLPEGDRRLTSAHPGLGGLRRKVIASPPASQPSSWVWRRPAGLGIPAPPGWFTTSALHSPLHPQPARQRQPAKSATQPAPGGAIAPCLCGRTPLGPAGRREEPNFSLRLSEASPLLLSSLEQLRLRALPGHRLSWACGSGSPPFSAHLRVPQYLGLLRALPGAAEPRPRGRLRTASSLPGPQA